MTKESACCQRLSEGGPSPFDVSMLGWYDGPISGLAKCRGCGRAYHFDLVAWDSEQDERLYGFAEVTVADYEAIVRLMAETPSPERAREQGDKVMLRVRDALAASYERNLLVLTSDLSQVIRTAQIVAFERWKFMLGID